MAATPSPSPSHLARRDANLRAAAFLFLALILLGSLALSFVVTPEDIESGRVWLSPTCTFKRVTGWECLGCGLTRGFSALSHARWGDALEYNRLAPVFYLGFWLGGGASLLAFRRAVSDRLRAAAAASVGSPEQSA